MRDSKAEFQFIDFAKRSRDSEPQKDPRPEYSNLRAKDWAWIALWMSLSFGSYIAIAWKMGWLP